MMTDQHEHHDGPELRAVPDIIDETTVPKPSSNGDGDGTVRADAGPLDGIEWRTSFDRASVERFAAEVAAERKRLEAAVAAAEARIADVERRRAERHERGEDELGALVLLTKGELDRIDQEHREAVAAIRREAEEEAARLLEAARVEAEKADAAAASLHRLVTIDGTGGQPAAPAGDPGARTDAG